MSNTLKPKDRRFQWAKLVHGVKVMVKCSRYKPGVAQRLVRGIALLFHDRGTRRGWVDSSTPQPHFTPGKDPVPIVQEVGWATGPVWKGVTSRSHRDSIPDRPARSQSLYRLSYPTFLIHIRRVNMPTGQSRTINLRVHSLQYNSLLLLKHA